jgi:hypothetical protein
MSIEFTCPACREWVSVNEALAGLHARCPRCSTSVPVPDSSSGQPVPSGAADDRVWQAPRRPWYDDEDDRDRPEYGARRRDPYWSPRGDSDPAWQVVRHGVNLEFIAVVILICAYAGYFLMQCAVLTVGPGMGPGGQGALGVLALLGIVLGLAVVAVLILAVVGGIMCCLAPPGVGARGLAIASISCLGAAILLVFAAIAIGLTDRFGRRSEAPGLAMLGLAGLLFLATYILYLLFLRAVAVSFGNYPLGARVVTYLVVSLVLPLVLILLLILFAVSAGPRMAMGDQRGLLLLGTLVQGVVTLLLLAWLSSLQAQVRDTIGQSRGAWRDDYGV